MALWTKPFVEGTIGWLASKAVNEECRSSLTSMDSLRHASLKSASELSTPRKSSSARRVAEWEAGVMVTPVLAVSGNAAGTAGTAEPAWLLFGGTTLLMRVIVFCSEYDLGKVQDDDFDEIQ